MLNGVVASLRPGEVETLVSNGGPHQSAVWAKMLANKLVGIADTAPQPIRDQAQAFKVRIHHLSAYYINEARRDTVAHLITALEREGMMAAAAFVRAQRIV